MRVKLALIDARLSDITTLTPALLKRQRGRSTTQRPDFATPGPLLRRERMPLALVQAVSGIFRKAFGFLHSDSPGGLRDQCSRGLSLPLRLGAECAWSDAGTLC